MFFVPTSVYGAAYFSLALVLLVSRLGSSFNLLGKLCSYTMAVWFHFLVSYDWKQQYYVLHCISYMITSSNEYFV